MAPQWYAYIGVIALLMMLGRVVWRRASAKVDWELIVAFVRLDFPAEQRDIAQKVAAGLAEMVGSRIKRLRPEHSLRQIVDWSEEHVDPWDLVKVFDLAYGVTCVPETTFRSLVEKITDKQRQSPMAK